MSRSGEADEGAAIPALDAPSPPDAEPASAATTTFATNVAEISAAPAPITERLNGERAGIRILRHIAEASLAGPYGN